MKLGSFKFLSMAILLSGCSQSTDIAPFSKEQICKATISKVMGRSPSIMSIERVDGGIIYLSYKRPDDGKKWTYRCKINGSYSIWASETGRWRDHPADSKISFSINGSILSLFEKYTDGSSTNKSFSLQELGN